MEPVLAADACGFTRYSTLNMIKIRLFYFPYIFFEIFIQSLRKIHLKNLYLAKKLLKENLL
jgi:hypothetical protein